MSIEKIGTCKNSLCNKTHLDIEKATERGLQHRDYIAHTLRWTHVLKYVKKGINILDVGCGNGMMAQTLYVNKFDTNYVGCDIRIKELEKADARKLKKEPRLICIDICKNKIPLEDDWADILTCFEVVEHIPESSLDFVLSELHRCVKPDGKVLLSTPNYDALQLIEKRIVRFINNYFVNKGDDKWLQKNVNTVMEFLMQSGLWELLNTAVTNAEKKDGNNTLKSIHQQKSISNEKKMLQIDGGNNTAVGIIKKIRKSSKDPIEKVLKKCGIILEESVLNVEMTIYEFLKFTTQNGILNQTENDNHIILKKFGHDYRSCAVTVIQLLMQSLEIDASENDKLNKFGIKSHLAGNHIHEYTEFELRNYLEKYFVVKKQYGTFASQKDIKPVLTDAEKKLWDALREYYDVNMFSVLFAPNHPAESRNILWVLEKIKTKKSSTILNDTKTKNDKDMWEM